MVQSFKIVKELGIKAVDKELNMLKMGTEELTLTCSHGKIILWIGRKASKELIRRIIFDISKIDACIELEFEVICDFESIQSYESKGFILVSYAKAFGGYKAIFNIPFSNEESLLCFLDFLMEDLKKTNITQTFLWDGNDAKIRLLFDEMSDVRGWVIEEIYIKGEGSSDKIKLI